MTESKSIFKRKLPCLLLGVILSFEPALMFDLSLIKNPWLNGKEFITKRFKQIYLVYFNMGKY